MLSLFLKNSRKKAKINTIYILSLKSWKMCNIWLSYINKAIRTLGKKQFNDVKENFRLLH